jgi:putative serine protease PepD
VNLPNGEKLPAIPLACCGNDLKIGHFVAILGASEDGNEPTQTMGIVSALDRLDGAAVQTDALTNYGNAGGPVIDLRGRLLGIASHVVTHADWSQQNSGVGFFTQCEKITACLDDLKAGRDMKAPTHAFLGLELTSSDDEADVRGVKLERILPDSPAAGAHLQPGDIILAVDGMDTYSWPELVRVLKAHQPGDTIEIAYQRGAAASRTKTVLGGKQEESK